MADCAAAPSRFCADWVHEIAEQLPAVRADRTRLLAPLCFALAVEEGRPFRHDFPLGAPGRE